MSPHHGETRLVRFHTVTGGKGHPSRNTVDVATVLASGAQETAGLVPESRQLVNVCESRMLSVAECASILQWPVGIAKVVASDLVDSGHLRIHAAREAPNENVLRQVLEGLRALV